MINADLARAAQLGRTSATERANILMKIARHTQLIIDVVPGRGGMFSLENGRDVRFLTRSRLFTNKEADRLEPVG